MKPVGASNQEKAEKALVGAFSMILKTDGSFAALIWSVQERCCRPGGWCPAGPAPAETSGCRLAATDSHPLTAQVRLQPQDTQRQGELHHLGVPGIQDRQVSQV